MTITPSRLTESSRSELFHHHRLLVRTRPGAVCPVACPGARPENHRHCVPGEWGLYIAEVIVSAGLYMKTRNPMLFVGGLAFLVVITRSFFALAG